jgi:hypothetical protein
LPISLRFRGVPAALQPRFQEILEDALDGDWTATLSQSHLDGQWHLQLDGDRGRYRVVLPALREVRVRGLHHLLRELVDPDVGSARPHR